MKKPGQIKTENSEEQYIYELNRKKSGGGGIAIGVQKDLEPVWISEGDDHTEILVVEIKLNQFKVRCVCGYGPQESDKLEKKELFWNRLSAEVSEALVNEAALIIQMDGNLWAGSQLVPGDPNPTNKNGKLFLDFLDKFPHLTVVNSLDICEGVITRYRKTKTKVEKAVLDFFIVCSKMLPYAKKMLIDENRQFPLTNFSRRMGKVIAKDSDHNTTFMEFDISYTTKPKPRTEKFNLRNKDCQKSLTSNSQDLNECFKNQNPLKSQANKWFNTLKKKIQLSFKKIRISQPKNQNETSKLFMSRGTLRQKLKLAQMKKKMKSLKK